MSLFYDVIFQPENRVEGFCESRGNCYQLADGSRVAVQTTPVWCRRCGTVTDGEEVEPLDEIDRRLAELDDPSSEASRDLSLLGGLGIGGGDDPRLWEIARLTRRRRWREGRATPPKCVRCGSPDMVVFPVDRPVPRPSGAGTVEVRVAGMCSPPWNEWYFTSEGERVWATTHALLRAPGRVSVWVGMLRSEVALRDYLSAPFGFESDFGFRIDPSDRPRVVVVEDGPPEAVHDLLAGLPGSHGFAGAAAAEAWRRLNWTRVTAAVAFYGLQYDPKHDRSDADSTLRFAGAFAVTEPR
jgi:hypothetical protein